MSSDALTLAALIQAMSLTRSTRDEIAELEVSLANASEDDRQEGAEALTKLKETLLACVSEEETLRKSALGILQDSDKHSNDHGIEVDPPATTESKAQERVPLKQGSSSFSFKIPTPAKYERGQNFSKYCERFRDYITLSKIKDDNLHILFLNLIDDFTQDKLRKVHLTPGQRKDATLFTEIYEKKINPAHDGRTYRAKLSELKQNSGEKVEDFVYRITDTASRAYTDVESQLQEEACFTTLMKGLRDQELRMKLHENTMITTFEEAVDEATRLENLRETLKKNRQTPEEDIDTDRLEVLHVESNDKYPQSDKHKYHNKNRGSYQSQRSSKDTTFENKRSDPRNGNDARDREAQKKGGQLICYKCNMPNHIARHCRASLN